MRERPILFSAPMVRAILEGRKTQTRRVAKGVARCQHTSKPYWPGMKHGGDFVYDHHCPYGVPGDRLWVRETFTIETSRNVGACDYEPPFDDGRPVKRDEGADGEPYWMQCHYRATDPEPELAFEDEEEPGPHWKPSIHMPRWASRITLELTEVGVRRLQEISEEDATAEGVEASEQTSWTGYDPRHDGYPTVFGESAPDWMEHAKIRIYKRSACEQFQSLWDSINKERGFGWEKNPWVWALTFQVRPPEMGREP